MRLFVPCAAGGMVRSREQLGTCLLTVTDAHVERQVRSSCRLHPTGRSLCALGTHSQVFATQRLRSSSDSSHHRRSTGSDGAGLPKQAPPKSQTSQGSQRQQHRQPQPPQQQQRQQHEPLEDDDEDYFGSLKLRQPVHQLPDPAPESSDESEGVRQESDHASQGDNGTTRFPWPSGVGSVAAVGSGVQRPEGGVSSSQESFGHEGGDGMRGGAMGASSLLSPSSDTGGGGVLPHSPGVDSTGSWEGPLSGWTNQQQHAAGRVQPLRKLAPLLHEVTPGSAGAWDAVSPSAGEQASDFH